MADAVSVAENWNLRVPLYEAHQGIAATAQGERGWDRSTDREGEHTYCHGVSLDEHILGEAQVHLFILTVG